MMVIAAIAAAIAIYNLLVGMGYVNSQPLLCEVLEPRLRSTAIGLMNMASCFAGGGVSTLTVSDDVLDSVPFVAVISST